MIRTPDKSLDKLNHIDGKLLERLKSDFGTPLHVIFTSRIEENARSFIEVSDRIYPNTKICFAVKSNPCRGAIRTVSRLGLGIDAVSEYELQAALEEGIPPNQIICNGNAKTDRYIELCVDSGAITAVDNYTELARLEEISRSHVRKTQILIRFAGMPLEGLTSADQSTAASWTKFGFGIDQAGEVFSAVKRCKNIHFTGISAHIGTQICEADGYNRLMDHIFKLMKLGRQAGMETRRIDIGGGYPANYMSRSHWQDFQNRLIDQLNGVSKTSEMVTWDNIPLGFKGVDTKASEAVKKWSGKAYWTEHPGAKMMERILLRKIDGGETVADALKQYDEPELILEPGRGLMGTAGITLAEVMGVKEIMNNTVVVLDLGIVNHGHALVSPDIHPFTVLPARDTDKSTEAFIAGRLCFTGDMISKVKVPLNRMPVRGDTIVVHHTGTYSADHFASNSCGFPRPAKIAVNGDGSVDVWRVGEKFGDVFGELINTEF